MQQNFNRIFNIKQLNTTRYKRKNYCSPPPLLCKYPGYLEARHKIRRRNKTISLKLTEIKTLGDKKNIKLSSRGKNLCASAISIMYA